MLFVAIPKSAGSKVQKLQLRLIFSGLLSAHIQFKKEQKGAFSAHQFILSVVGKLHSNPFPHVRLTAERTLSVCLNTAVMDL